MFMFPFVKRVKAYFPNSAFNYFFLISILFQIKKDSASHAVCLDAQGPFNEYKV